MTPERLDEIVAEAIDYHEAAADAIDELVTHVDELTAEIVDWKRGADVEAKEADRERAKNAELRAELDAWKATHKELDNMEAQLASAEAKVRELEVEVADILRELI